MEVFICRSTAPFTGLSLHCLVYANSKGDQAMIKRSSEAP
jgi:hypothetical protein